MIQALVLAIALVGCSKTADKSPPPALVGSAQPIPESTTIDWKNLDYDLGSLGTVKATGGRAEFRVVEDDDGTVHATQHADATSAWTGFLDLDDPAYVDLNGDGHDETAIPFELKSSQLEETRRQLDVQDGFGHLFVNGTPQQFSPARSQSLINHHMPGRYGERKCPPSAAGALQQ